MEDMTDKEESFYKWVKKHNKVLHYIHSVLIPDRGKWSLSVDYGLLSRALKKKPDHPLFIYEPEFGNKHTILFIPIDCPEWYRYDDMIDWEEETLYHKQQSRIVDLFKTSRSCGIYPYNMMELKPGRQALAKVDKMPPADYNRYTGRWDGSPPLVDDVILKHLLNDWAPMIPTTIKMFCLYSNVFKDINTIYELKPLLYVWWS